MTSLNGIELVVNNSTTIRVDSPREASNILLGKSGGYDFDSKEHKREFVRQLNQYLLDCAERNDVQVMLDAAHEKIGSLEGTNKDLQSRHLKVMQQLDSWVQDNAQIREPVTGLYNQAYLEEALEQTVSAARRYERNLSFALFKICNYESLVRMYGTEVGDRMAVDLAGIIKENTRGADIAGRMGSNQYAVVMPETRSDGAMIVVRRIQGQFATTMRNAEYIQHGVTANSTTVNLGKDDDAKKLVERALRAII